MSTTSITSSAQPAQDGKIRVAIIGAGLGGLTLAAALHVCDKSSKLEINLYEGAHEISEVGAGLGMWPRTWRIMRELGFEESFEPFFRLPPDDKEHLAWRVRKADQSIGAHIQDIIIKGTPLVFHRADLQQTLLKKSPPESIHLNKRLSSFEETPEGKVRLQFRDGTYATCDILVGMDGIKSVVRKGFLLKQGLTASPSLNPVWTGTVCYRGLLRKEELEKILPEHPALSAPMMYIGKLKHLAAYPVQHESGQVLVNVAGYVSDLSKKNTSLPQELTYTTCSHEELLSVYAGWEPEVQALVQCLTRPNRWPIQNLVPLESYASGCIAVGGDAAHAMPPHLGSGAGQAIEDAYMLASLLTHPAATKANISKISEIYTAVRCPEGNRVLNASIRTGLRYQLILPEFENNLEVSDVQLTAEQLREAVGHVSQELEWTWKQSAQNDRLRALEMMSAIEYGH